MLSYTNRAVDEICGMLTENGIDFIRLGNAYSCDPKYKPYLLSERLAQQPTLAGIKSLIQQTQLIVATTSTIAARPFIFHRRPIRWARVRSRRMRFASRLRSSARASRPRPATPRSTASPPRQDERSSPTSKHPNIQTSKRPNFQTL